MIQKKEINPNTITEGKKKRKGKSKRHLLTSMTFHVVDKTKHQPEDEREEDPEDGFEEQLGNIEEEALTVEDEDDSKPNRDSKMSDQDINKIEIDVMEAHNSKPQSAVELIKKK